MNKGIKAGVSCYNHLGSTKFKSKCEVCEFKRHISEIAEK